MKQNKQSLIIYFRKILENKDNSEIDRENARKELLKLLNERSK